MMSVALQIPCITSHYYPETLVRLKSLCEISGLNFQICEQATCCGLPYFEKGELKTAKNIGEYNLSVYTHEKVISGSSKCRSVFEIQYPRIFNNTVSHNAAMQLARNTSGIRELLEKLPASYTDAAGGHYFLVSDCCSDSWLSNWVKRLKNCSWSFASLQANCCGAGASLPATDRELAGSMSGRLINEFKKSGAGAMVFEDDICRKQIDITASASGLELKTHNIIDLLINP